MTVQVDVIAHLRTEISAPDPWLLASNPFEHKRYAIMLNMIAARGPFASALEVGCAAGFFTKLLADRCASLHVVDVLPEAIERARRHVGARPHVTWEAASIESHLAKNRTFDLIVVAEVLAYLPDYKTLKEVVRDLCRRVRPGGLLIFGSAVDETCRRWGLLAGAETIMAEMDKQMFAVDRTSCKGSYWGENSIVAAYAPLECRQTQRSSPSNLQEIAFVPYRPVQTIPARSVLVLAPHPDDEVYGCGGVILSHVAQGTAVRVVIASDGGGALEGADRSRTVRQRRDESCAAARILGYGQPIFWDLPDRALVYSEELTQRIVAAVGDADLIYAPSPTELHPDHRGIALAAIEALSRSDASKRLVLYEISAPLQPNVLLDISAHHQCKSAAMACFSSQLERQKYDEQIAALNRFRTYTLPKAVNAAEAYFLVWAEELARDPLKFHWPAHDRHLTDAAERALRRELAALRNSTSWKLTRPLRAVSRRIRTFLRSGPIFVTGPLAAALKLFRRIYHRVYRSA
ncbi:MAG: SAM-dependent methyltransferase [Rhodospirillaceae bacterium]